MNSAELRDAAVVELKLTTAGWRKPNGNPNYPSGSAPMSTHWGKAMALLEQIGVEPEPEPPPAAYPCPGGAAWSACFDGNWNGWHGFNGNPNGPIPNVGGYQFTNQYFSFQDGAFKAYVDAGATTGGQAGQRTMVVVWVYNSTPGDGKTQAHQGSEQWYRSRLYFPADYQPVPSTSFNWLWEIHNWPDTACCAHLSLGVVTNSEDGGPSGGQRLSLRCLGGGSASNPVESLPQANAGASPTPAGYKRQWMKGPDIERGHWYDLIFHVEWDVTADGSVEWWLDGQLIGQYSGPTLYWYQNKNTSNATYGGPGPGMGYLMCGNYRQTAAGSSYVLHDSVLRGLTRASLG